MHELAVCQALLREVAEVARLNGASTVTEIRVLLGPLSGLDGALLIRAFEVARAGTPAAKADLVIEAEPVRIRCNVCGVTHETVANRLRCPDCEQPFPKLVSGDAMTLASVSLQRELKQSNNEVASHV